MKAWMIVLFSTLLLIGCATQEMTPQELALIQAQMQQQTLTIDCPSGCSVQYRDPRDQVQIPQRTNGWDAAISLGQSVERLVTGAVPIVGMGYLGKRAIDALEGSGAVTTTTTNTDNSSYVGDYSGDGSGATHTDNSVGDYSGDNSGNAGQIMPGNSGRIDSDDDYTAPPTVVEQPAPVIVPAP